MTNTSLRLKTWLQRKTHTLFGVSRLHGQLAQISEDLQSAHAATAELQKATAEVLYNLGRTVDKLAQAGQAAASQPSPQAAPQGVAVESLGALERQGLFILGAARSGTTILTRSLNRAAEILVFEEPSFFLNQQVTDFVGFFNKLHAKMGNRCMKGTYLAPPLWPEVGPLPMLDRLRRDYRYLGEKTALGPHDFPANWQQMYLDFQAKYFLRARYIYILRTPVESLWSMHKMFPRQPVARLFDAWLRAVALSLDAYHVFPHSRAVFFDDLGPAMIARLGEWLEVSIPCLSGTFGPGYMNSAVTAGDIPDVLRPCTALCRECTDLYRDLRESFSRDDFTYCGSATEWHYFETKLRHIEDMLARLVPDADSGDGQLRVAA